MILFEKISENKQLLILGLLTIFIAISFETAQQLYYIRRFSLSQEATFFGLFRYQAIRWIIWAIMSYPLVLFARRKAEQDALKLKDFYQYTTVIISLVILDIFLISIAQILLTEENFSLNNLISEYFPFFTFQKAPFYTLGYIAMAIILHFYALNKQLQVEILELGELKKINSELYAQLSHSHNDKATVLKIKVGNKQKLIPVEEINWIEADDYCAKIHTLNDVSYAMRISLKALEQKLNNNFLRVHRGAIVNMLRVAEFQGKDASKLLLLNGDEVPVAKSKSKLVRDFLAEIS